MYPGKPSAFILPGTTDSKQTQGEWLLNVCESYIDKYLFDEGDIDGLVEQTHQLELASLGHYNCRIENCEKVYVYHSARVRYIIRMTFYVIHIYIDTYILYITVYIICNRQERLTDLN